MGKRRKPSARQRAARRYWNDVRAIARQKSKPVTYARKVYGAALKRSKKSRRDLNRRELLKLTAAVKRIARPRPRIPADEGAPVPADWFRVWRGRAFAFSLKSVYEKPINRRLRALGVSGFYAIAIELFNADGDLLERKAYRMEYQGDSLDGWWDAYHNAIREELGVGRGEDRGGEKLYDRIKREYEEESFSIEVTDILKKASA